MRPVAPAPPNIHTRPPVDTACGKTRESAGETPSQTAGDSHATNMTTSASPRARRATQQTLIDRLVLMQATLRPRSYPTAAQSSGWFNRPWRLRAEAAIGLLPKTEVRIVCTGKLEVLWRACLRTEIVGYSEPNHTVFRLTCVTPQFPLDRPVPNGFEVPIVTGIPDVNPEP